MDPECKQHPERLHKLDVIAFRLPLPVNANARQTCAALRAHGCHPGHRIASSAPALRGSLRGSFDLDHVLQVVASHDAARSSASALAQPDLSVPFVSGVNQTSSFIAAMASVMRRVTLAGRTVEPRSSKTRTAELRHRA